MKEMLMLTKVQEKKCATWMQWFHTKAETFYNRKLKCPVITFTLRGTRAGLTYYFNDRVEIQINEEVWLYGAKEVKETIGHELAHCFVYQKYKDKAKDHGAEWKELVKVFRITNERCHSLNLTPARKNPVNIYCGCKTRKCTKEKAEKLRNGEMRFCFDCLQPLSTVPYSWLDRKGVSDIGLDLK